MTRAQQTSKIRRYSRHRMQAVADMDDLMQEAELARLTGRDPVAAVWNLLRREVRRATEDLSANVASPAIPCRLEQAELLSALRLDEDLRGTVVFPANLIRRLRAAASHLNREDYL